MNILDLLIIVFVILGMIIGYRRGLILQAVNLIGFLVALVVAYRFSSEIAPLLSDFLPFSGSSEEASGSIWTSLFDGESMLYTIIAFFLLFILTKWLLNIVARVLHGIAGLPGLNFVNRLLGGGLGLLKVLVFNFVVVHVLLFIPWQTGQIWVEQSTLALWFLEQSPLYEHSAVIVPSMAMDQGFGENI